MESDFSTCEGVISRIATIIQTRCNSLNECARDINVPVSTLRSMMNGGEPKWSHLCKLIKKYNLNSNWLLFGEGEINGEGTSAPTPVVEKEPEEQREVVTTAMNDLIKQNGQLIDIIANLSKK